MSGQRLTKEPLLPQDNADRDTFLLRHYQSCWGSHRAVHGFDRGRAIPQQVRVVEFAPTDRTFCWVYATIGLSLATAPSPIELFLLSPSQSSLHVELLTAIAYYHQTGEQLGLGHTVNFGRPWLPHSQCDHGLISLPYTFGPSLEWAVNKQGRTRVLWLVPITQGERAFKVNAGQDALEDLFESRGFNYLDPARPSVVT